MPSPMDALSALLGGGSANDPTALYGLLQGRKRDLTDNVAKQKMLGKDAGFAYDQPTLLDATNEELRADAANPTSETLRQAPENELMKILGIQTQGAAAVEAAKQNKLGAFANADAQRTFQAGQNEANRANTRTLADTNNQARMDLAAQNAAAKSEAADAKTAESKKLAQGALQDTRSLVQKIQDNPNFESMYGSGIGRIAQYLPGTASHDTNADIEQLTGQQIINLIAEMKRQSATGATGFGQLSEKEGELLKNASTQLGNRGLSPAHAKAQLALIAQHLDSLLGGGNGASDVSSAAPTGAPVLQYDPTTRQAR